MSRVSAIHRSDHFIGDKSNEYLVRLWGEDSDYGILWVDVATYRVQHVTKTPSGYTQHGALVPESACRMYENRDQRLPSGALGDVWTEDPEKAVAIFEGFVRDASCTQFHFEQGLHVDGVREMAGLCHALAEAQRLALGLMQESAEARDRAPEFEG